MNTDENQYGPDKNHTDSITVATVDGTTQALTVTMHGTNDAAIITGTSTETLTETNVAQSTGGTLSATDVDSSNAFVDRKTVVEGIGYGTVYTATHDTRTDEQ